MCEFVDGIKRVAVDDGRTRLQRTVIGDGKIRDVGQKQRDPCAFLDSEFLLQRAAEKVDLSAEFGVAHFGAEKIQRHRFRKSGAGLRYPFENRRCVDLGEKVDAGGVVVEPGA